MDRWPIWYGLWMAVAGFPVAMYVHELGHLSAALLLRLDPRVISLGRGRILLRRRLRGVWFVVRELPLSGYVEVLPPEPTRWLSWIILLLSGVLANCVALVLLGAGSTGRPLLGRVLQPIAVAQVVTVAIALSPYWGRYTRSDGVQLAYVLWRLSREVLLDLRRALTGQARPTSRPSVTHSDAWREIVYQTNRRGLGDEAWARREMAEALSRMLRAGGLPDFETVCVLDTLIDFELVCSDIGLSPASLDAWSAELLALAPTISHRVTRAMVLAALGRIDEAESELGPLADQELAATDRFGRQLALLQVAIARSDHVTAAHLSSQARLSLAAIPREIRNRWQLGAVVDRLVDTSSEEAAVQVLKSVE